MMGIHCSGGRAPSPSLPVSPQPRGPHRPEPRLPCSPSEAPVEPSRLHRAGRPPGSCLAGGPGVQEPPYRNGGLGLPGISARVR